MNAPPALRSALLRAASLAPLVALASLPACSSDNPAPTRDEPVKTAAAAAPQRPAPAPNGAETWNAAQIEWLSFEAGVERAKAQNKPICLVIYTTWCPHCKNFSRVFDDPRVVERAKEFVMIRLDADKDEVAAMYAKDGSYIPRTFFLLPDGTPDFDITTGRDKFRYFYDEKNPAGILAGMADALVKLRK